MDEVSKNKLKTFLNLKFVTSLSFPNFSPHPYASAPLNSSFKDVWNEWRSKYGILNDHEVAWSGREGYVKIEAVADRVILSDQDGKLFPSGFVLVPEDFAKKVLVLGYLPD